MIFPPKLGTSQECPFLPFLFNVLLVVLGNVTRQEKKGMQIKGTRKEVKLSFFADDMIIYVENWNIQNNYKN